jgi:hypothetical protein
MSAVLLLLVLATPQAAPPDRSVGPDIQRKEPAPPPRVRERRPDAVLTWNGVALEAIRTARTPPPMAARNLAIFHTAIADAVNTIYQTHRPYRVRLRATEPIDPNAAIAAAAHGVLIALYPKQASKLDRDRDRALAAVTAGTAKSRGITLGRYVAERMIAWRLLDGSTRTKAYAATQGIGVWQPTPPGYAAALYPHWGDVTPFGIRDKRRFRPTPPPALTSQDYTKDLDEVRTLGARNSLKRSAEQSIIAWFWEGEPGTCTPPGQWNQIAAEVALDRKNSLPENARLFALLNICLADAAIVCWDCKYHFRYWRPVAAIRRATDARGDPRWLPLLETPPFPSYTSGHSTFSGAAATVLGKFFGTDKIAFTAPSDSFPGTERSFKSFSEAAREAGRSRIYGGIHYECDNREGLAIGKSVAEEVFRTRLLPEDDTLSSGEPVQKTGSASGNKERSPGATRRERP